LYNVIASSRDRGLSTAGYNNFHEERDEIFGVVIHVQKVFLRERSLLYSLSVSLGGGHAFAKATAGEAATLFAKRWMRHTREGGGIYDLKRTWDCGGKVQPLHPIAIGCVLMLAMDLLV
jgi:hypothetical protein